MSTTDQSPASADAHPPPRRRRHLRRAAPLVATAALIAVAAVVAAGSSGSPSSEPRPPAVDAVASPGAESSSWYCAGGTGSSGNLAMPTVYLTNVSHVTVRGHVFAVSDTGSTGNEAVVVPARTQVAVAPAGLAHGSWLATTVNLDGGGVVATQAVVGSNGWSEAPCASLTAHTWYFASGSTAGGHDLFVSLFNPTATAAVVDLDFRTPSGLLTQPPQFQGILVPPQGVSVADVGSYVQGASDISADAVTRAGLVVADELEIATGSRQGVSLRLGTPLPERAWSVPRTVDVTGGSAVLHVYNPTGAAQSVTASFRLPSGPTAPITDELAPGATWLLDLSATTRLPRNDDFATRVDASGGGVVVDRVLEAPAKAASPQWGSAAGVERSQWSAGEWVLPAPGVPGHPATAKAAPFALALASQSRAPVTVRFGVLDGTTVTPLGRGVLLLPGAATVIEPAQLAPAGLRPIVVTANGPLAVSQDLVPAGSPGVVTLPGIALP